ncbi:MAG: type II toxin-antitoxin system VapB family antitoxin [Pseudomonadota bacterium]
MRTNIEIDDALMTEALKIGDYKTKKEAVEAGLKLLVQTRKQAGLKDLRGALSWDGDLEQMRSDR